MYLYTCTVNQILIYNLFTQMEHFCVPFATFFRWRLLNAELPFVFPQIEHSIDSSSSLFLFFLFFLADTTSCCWSVGNCSSSASLSSSTWMAPTVEPEPELPKLLEDEELELLLLLLLPELLELLSSAAAFLFLLLFFVLFFFFFFFFVDSAGFAVGIAVGIRSNAFLLPSRFNIVS